MHELDKLARGLEHMLMRRDKDMKTRIGTRHGFEIHSWFEGNTEELILFSGLDTYM